MGDQIALVPHPLSSATRIHVAASSPESRVEGWLSARRHRRALALSWGRPILRGLVCHEAAPSWTVGRVPRRRIPARALFFVTVPRIVRPGFIPPWTGPPSEFLTTSRPSDPSVGADSPEVPAPCGDVTRTSPVWSGFRPPRPGPALRFSQPPGGFLARPGSRPCFMPLPPVGRLSLQSFASQESLHPSRGRLLPCGHPRAPACAVATSIAAGFADALPGLPGPLPASPRSHGCPFGARAMVRPASRAPRDRARRTHARPRGSPASKPRSSCEARATGPAGLPAGVAVLSWAFAPPEPSPPAPRTLLTRHALGAQHLRPPLAQRPDATSGTSRPPHRVSPDDSR